MHFSTSAAADVPTVVNVLDRRQADPLTTPLEPTGPADKPGVPDQYAYNVRALREKERLKLEASIT